MKKVILFVVAGIIVALTAQFSNAGTLEEILGAVNTKTGWTLGGATAGAVLGQAVGENTTATVIGSLLGGGLGYLIKHELDRPVVQQNQSVQQAPASEWVNPDVQQSSIPKGPAIEQPGNPLDDARVQYALERHPSGQGVDLMYGVTQVSFVPQRAVQKGQNFFCRPLEIYAAGQKRGEVSTCRTQQGVWVETQI